MFALGSTLLYLLVSSTGVTPWKRVVTLKSVLRARTPAFAVKGTLPSAPSKSAIR